MNLRIDVFWHPPVDLTSPTLADVLAAITDLKNDFKTEITKMSGTFSSEIDASTASLQADFATMTAGITELKTELATALAGITPGATVTQAQVTALQSVQTSFDTLAASLPTAPAATAPTS